MLRLTDQIICVAPSGVTTIRSIEGFSQFVFWPTLSNIKMEAEEAEIRQS